MATLLAALLISVALLSGCASPANPRPPSLHLQEVPAAPQAERLGDQVILTWETPASTTDGGRPGLPLTAVLCRESTAPAPVGCVPVLRLPASPGAPGHAADTLPPALLASQALIAYRVEIQNSRGRSASASPPAFVAAGPAPAPAGALSITGRPGGALITWAGAPSSGIMELTRTPANPPAVSGAQARPAAKAPALTADPSAPVLLRPAAGRADTNGMLDSAVLDSRLEGTAFRYVGQRVETVTLAGHALELRGLPSPPAVFTYAHSFPPDVPSGLIAVPSLAPPAIDLSWEASASADLLGYNVYRRDAAGAAFKLLNPTPVPSPSFRDQTVVPGRLYTYRVTALDRHHKRSAPSSEVQETVTP